MRKKFLKSAVAMAVALQMVCGIMPNSLPFVSAAADYYLNETFATLSKWTNAGEATVVNDEDTAYMHYKSDAQTPIVASRALDKSIPSSTAVYIAELDVRFEDGNSGVVEFYGGSNLGPTIIFDGSQIKSKTGNPSTYVTMYSGATAGKWYNVKLLVNGRSSIYGYTTEIEGSASMQTTKSSIIRNLRNSELSKINVTNQVNSEKDAIRSGAVDVRNLKIYKALPDTLEIGAEDDITEVSVPQTDTASTVNFTVKSAKLGGIDLTSYSLLSQEILSFKLYDENNETEVSPKGISINPMSGVLSVTSEANGVSEGIYTVRLTNYDNSAYASRQISVVPKGEAAELALVTAPNTIPVPNAGKTTTQYGVKITDKYGSEISGVPLVWTLTDTNGVALEDDNLTIDKDTGIVTAKPGVRFSNVLVNVQVVSDPTVFTVSDPIEVYQMTANTIEISGDDYIAVSKDNSVSVTYTAELFDQNGVKMPEEEVKVWTVDSNGVSIENGILTVPENTADTTVTVTVKSGNVTAQKTVNIYNPVVYRIEIDGDRSMEIPKSGTKSFKYTAKAFDQNSALISDIVFTWELSAYDNTGISQNGDTVTVGTDAKEQTVTLSAAADGIKGDMKITVTENPFRYKPVDGGFEIDTTSPTSAKNYTRPIYAPHINDKGESSNRYLYYLGDRPKLVLSNASTSDFRRFMHMFLGIKDGKWLDGMQNVTARYVDGHEEYEITDPSFTGKIKLTYTRSDRIDGMMIKVELPDELKDKLVVAVAGQGGVKASQPTGGNSTNMEFNYQQTKDNKITISSDSFKITNNGSINFGGGSTNIDGTASVKMNFSIKDASAYSNGVSALLASTDATYPMVVGTTDGNEENTIYLLTAPQSDNNEDISNYKRNAKEYFDDGISYYKSVSETIKIDTPDPYVNSGVKAQVMAMDNIWDDPVITHGAIGWHNGQGGWRGGYCFVDANWGDRLKTNIAHYVKHQENDGRIWAYPSQDGRYNMSLVMVDILMQYWDWTGDKAFFTDTIEGKSEAVYNLVKGHLAFMDKEMQVPGTNLYENWLDAWNTDNKWNNGGAGSIATSYTWRAYNTMAEIAMQLGKEDDANAYQEKADAIKADMNKLLWDSDTGVFGELRERFGKGRLNTAPDLSSVYTVVDMGVATPEQVYQMMHFTDYAVPSIAGQDSIWDNIDFKYSSNRPPEHYSSDGLYVEEVMNNALAFFENGQRYMGMKQFRACLVPLMKGSAAGQGTVQHIIRNTLENNGHIDFGDCTSQYARTALEGIFGVKMHTPLGKVDIMPGFPEDWRYASVQTSYLSYDYKYENNTDIFSVSTEDSLQYQMHIPARSSKIESVKVNGKEVADYTVDHFVNVTTPMGKEAVIEVQYAEDEVAKVESDDVAGTNSSYTVSSNGKIVEVSDPQVVISDIPELNSKDVTFKLGTKQGNHTFFVTVEKNDMRAVLPVDVLINGGIELTDAQIVTGENAGISVRLTNNDEKAVTVSAKLSTVSGDVTENLTVPAKSSSAPIFVPVADETDLTPGNNKVSAKLTGDINKTITGEAVDWELKNNVENTDEQYELISLDEVVNQDLRTLHENKYDITYEGNEHYRLPDFYWVTKTKTGTPRTVLENGRSWWESATKSHTGDKGVPSSLTLTSGKYVTGAGVPFNISSVDGNNSAFVSLYNQFPDKMNIPVNTDGSKLYFMLSVSTNNMQSRIENARITVNFTDGTNEILPLTNPDNIDDWLNYQTANPYAESGYIEMLGDKAHSNVLALDLGSAKHIESVDFECLSSEVLAGLLGVTVVKGEVEDKDGLTVGEIAFDKDNLLGASSFGATVTVENHTDEAVNTELVIAHYRKDGSLRGVITSLNTVNAGSTAICKAVYDKSEFSEGDYVKAFLWDSLNTMKPLSSAQTIVN